jgi:hypothetical protein
MQWYRTSILIGLIGCDLVPPTSSIDLTMVIHITNAFFLYYYDRFQKYVMFYRNQCKLMWILL